MSKDVFKQPLQARGGGVRQSVQVQWLQDALPGSTAMLTDPAPCAPQVVRLFVHECERVLRDRLVSDADLAKFGEFRDAVLRKHFADVPLVRGLEGLGRLGVLEGWGYAVQLAQCACKRSMPTPIDPACRPGRAAPRPTSRQSRCSSTASWCATPARQRCTPPPPLTTRSSARWRRSWQSTTRATQVGAVHA